MDRPRYPTQLKIEQSMTEVEVEEATKMDLPLLLQRSSKGLDDSILQSFRQRWPPPSTAAFASGMNGCCPFKVQLPTMRAVMWSMSKSWFCWDMDWNVPPSSSTDCTKEGVGWLHSSVPAEMATSKQPPPPSAEPVHIIGCHPFKGHSSVPAEMATSKRLPLNRPAPYHWMQPLQSPTGLDGEDAGGLQV